MSQPEHQDSASRDLVPELAPLGESAAAAAAHARAGLLRSQPPRPLPPHRKQIELRASDLESLLGEGHRARLVWGDVEQQDLSCLSASFRMLLEVERC